jgi:cobalt-zinc-cadmium efflux system protein
VWSITPERPMLTLDAYVGAGVRLGQVNLAIKTRLHEVFDIDHATVDVMRRGGAV